MKLFETKWTTKDGTHYTQYVTSRKEAGSLIRRKPSYTISKVTLPDRLSTTDWIKLLEGDAPGMQELEATPVDFITDRKVLKTKERTHEKESID